MQCISVEGVTKEFVVTVNSGKGPSAAFKNLFCPQKKVIRALDNISFYVNQGEVLGFLGPNGAGKSTMIKILTGVLTPTSGKADVAGLTPYKSPRDNARQVGVVFGQRSRLWWSLPVKDSFEYTRALYSIKDEVYEANMKWFTENFGISEILEKPVRTLSLGQKMRAEITMAMLHSPKILYLDEPTIGLDVVGKNELHNLIRCISVECRTTVLLVTHDIIDIERLCNRVIVIDKGKIIWQGGLQELKRAKGGKKVFCVVYASATPVIQSDILQPVKCEGLTHIYSCDSEAAPIEAAIAELSRAGVLADLTISDAELDEVMRRLYTE